MLQCSGTIELRLVHDDDLPLVVESTLCVCTSELGVEVEVGVGVGIGIGVEKECEGGDVM